MALPAEAHLEYRATAEAGSLNGGGFNPANANFINDWTMAATETVRLEPNGDASIGANWTTTPTLYDNISQTGVTDPSTPSTSTPIEAFGSTVDGTYTSANYQYVANMSTQSNAALTTTIAVHIYAKTDQAGSDPDFGYASLYVRLSISGTPIGSWENVTISTSYGWDTVTFSGLSLTQSDLDGLQVMMAMDPDPVFGAFNTLSIAQMYAIATYVGSSTNGTSNTPKIKSATYTPVAGDVGYHVYLKSGTSVTPGWYPITAVSGGVATLDASVGAAVQFINGRYQANTTAGIATIAAPTAMNGSIDYTQHDDAILTATDLACASVTTTVTSAGAGFTPAMVGNYLHLISGTGLTAGWYEIVSYTNTTTIVLDRAPTGTSGTGGTFYIGGAISLASSLDDEALEISVAGNRLWMKNGTYTIGESIDVSTTATATLNCILEGYNSLRGDRPVGDTRPVIAAGANSWTFSGAHWLVRNISVTTTAANGMRNNSSNHRFLYCKSVNSSTTANRGGFVQSSSGGNLFMYACEGVGYRGYGFGALQQSSIIVNSYFHDSNIGFQQTGSAALTLRGCIIAGNVTAAIDFSAAQTSTCLVENNTLYGAETPRGVGVDMATNTSSVRLFGNIIYGFVTGVNHADATQNSGISDYNDYYNNTTNQTNWLLGPNDQVLDPGFVSVSVAVNEGTVTAGAADNIVTDSTQDFTAEGVVAGRDYFYLVSGTNCTAGIYGISTVGTTTITLDLDPTSSSTGSSIVYQILKGRNWAIGTNLKALGFPGAFQGTATTGYMDIGAVQRQEAGSGGASSYSYA